MSDMIQKLESLFLPDFQSLIDKFSLKYPKHAFKIYQTTVGSSTAYQGYSFGIECIFPHKLLTEPDSIDLSLNICYLATQPKIMADVCWVSGCVETSFHEDWQSSGDWPKITDEILHQINEDMPRLIQAFETAINRGHPINKF